MEIKHSKPKSSKIFSFLPKSATVTFQNPPFSPGRGDHHHHSHKLRGFSGPMIPDEARRKPINGRGGEGNSFEEPTSPKVSCMGQIKHKKKKVCESKCNGLPRNEEINKPKSKSKPKLKPSLSFGNLFHGGRGKQGRKKSSSSDASSGSNGTGGLPPICSDRTAAAAPSLDQMKRFASGRDTFANFDWKAVHDRRVSSADHRDYYSDDDGSDGEEEEDEVIIPHSAPLMVGGGGGIGIALEPRKEINLWKRRTMAPPRPLQIIIN